MPPSAMCRASVSAASKSRLRPLSALARQRRHGVDAADVLERVGVASHRWIRAEPPLANARTCSSVAIVVSPGKVVSSAPCAQPELEGFLRRLAGQQAVEEAGREAVAAADAIDERRGRSSRRRVRLAVDPGDGAPAVPVGRVHLAQRRRDDLDLRVALDDAVHHPEEGAGIELRLGRDFRPGACRGPSAGPPRCRPARRRCSTMRLSTSTARSAPPDAVHSFSRKFRSNDVDRAGGSRRLHAFDDQLGGRRRQRREDAAAVKPADAAAEDRVPVEVAGLEPGGGLVGAVVEHDRARGRRARGRCRPSPCSARGRRRARSACRTAVTPIARTRSAIRSPIG